jgi:large subunit ribosomal protein L17
MRRTNARKFHRVRKVRNALLRSLAFSLIEKGKIKTTEAKAKEIRPVVEKFVSEAKKGTLGSRRILSAKLPQVAVAKLFKDLAPKYKDRKGGYTRIIKVAIRKSDGARMSVIEFV